MHTFLPNLLHQSHHTVLYNFRPTYSLQLSRGLEAHRNHAGIVICDTRRTTDLLVVQPSPLLQSDSGCLVVSRFVL